MDHVANVLKTLAEGIGERPVGSAGNSAAREFLAGVAEELGYRVETLPFACNRWEFGPSHLQYPGGTPTLNPGPFSPPLAGRFPVSVARSTEELHRVACAGRLLVLAGELAGQPLMPRDFPFYYPEEHREIIDLLTEKAPAAVIAVTGRHPLCGLSPFPLFEDGNLGIPNGYTEDRRILEAEAAEIMLDSRGVAATSGQEIFCKGGQLGGRVVVAAHIDTKYGTPGALDNGAGVATMVAVMEALASRELPYDLEFVPFNGEEYYGVSGQLAYLARLAAAGEETRLMVNLDGLGYRGSQNAMSGYNLGDRDTALLQEVVDRTDRCAPGDEWIAGDHAIFAFRGVPCVAVTSSNLMEQLIRVTHTPEDRFGLVEIALLRTAASAVAQILTRLTV